MEGDSGAIPRESGLGVRFSRQNFGSTMKSPSRQILRKSSQHSQSKISDHNVNPLSPGRAGKLPPIKQEEKKVDQGSFSNLAAQVIDESNQTVIEDFGVQIDT